MTSIVEVNGIVRSFKKFLNNLAVNLIGLLHPVDDQFLVGNMHLNLITIKGYAGVFDFVQNFRTNTKSCDHPADE
jgi:hypothetical protein